MKVKIIDNTYTEITREADPEDRWSGEDTDASHDILGLELTNTYYDLDTEFPIELGVNYYLLYAIYSTGDSFSHHEGKIDFIQLYKTASKAEDARKILLSPRQEDKFSATIKTESGKHLQMHIPWDGYFESLTNLNIEEVRLRRI
jgi:hypothetical protein